MITSFGIKNFYSVLHEQVVDLRVPDTSPDLPDRFPRPFEGAARVNKVLTIYGANGSGKSTILRAIPFLKWFVKSSFERTPSDFLPFFEFADKRAGVDETELWVEFDTNLIEGLPRCLYRYEVRIKADPDRVTYEALKVKPKRNYQRVFERTEEGILFSSHMQIAKNDPRRESIRPDCSLISTFAKFAHPLATKIVELMLLVQSNIRLMNKEEFPEKQAIEMYAENPTLLQALNKRIRFMDLGVEEIEIDETSEGHKAYFKHVGLPRRLLLARESHGTQQFFRFFPYLYFVLVAGGVAVMDEFDSDIHPLLLPEILRWFYDPATNPNNAQLIMSCHNPYLLEHLEKEEVAFTEKAITGETEVFSLRDIKGARRDTNLYAKYTGGTFGAVPRLG